MKGISLYIDEKLKFNKDFKVGHLLMPENYKELSKLLVSLIDKRGNEADFNDIDVSAVKNMSWLFDGLEDFNGDISQWDMSNCEYTNCMFKDCFNFNCDISGWDVSKVKNMIAMFERCRNFKQDISKWDVSSCLSMSGMFYGCTELKKNDMIPKWYK